MPKYIIVISDGCADLPLEALQGRTPLTACTKPHTDAMAARGIVGRARTVPVGIAPGSDTAILSIFGNDPRAHYTGRSPLEAAGSGIVLKPGNLSLRVNLAALEATADGRIMRSHSGGNIQGDEALALMQTLLDDALFQREIAALGMPLTASPSFRHIAVLAASPGAMQTTPPHEIIGKEITPHLPAGAGHVLHALMERSYALLCDHPINKRRVEQGHLAANMLWPWGEGSAIQLPNFTEKYGLRASAISAVPLVWGIASLAGVSLIKIPTATADLHTDYEAKARAAASALLGGDDCVFIHIEAPDECSHDGDLQGKIEAIQRIDARLLPLLTDALRAAGEDFRLLLLSDHYTLLSTRGHDATPVPFLLYDSRVDTGRGLPYDEASAEKGPMVDPATALLDRLFEQGA